jgi:heptosyltransferase II
LGVKGAVARIVVRAPNWLGDLVMALPAIATLRHHFNGNTVALACPASFVGFCQAIHGVDEVIALPGRGLGALGAHAAALADGHFDLAILLTNSFSSAWTVRRANIPERWGFRTDVRGRLLTRALPPPRRLRSTTSSRANADLLQPTASHHSHYYLALTDALGMVRQRPTLPIAVPDDRCREAYELLRARGRSDDEPLVGIAPGAAYGSAKRWPPPYVAELVDLLATQGRRAVLVGAAEDRPTARAIESALAGLKTARTSRSLIDLVGETDLPLLMGVLSWCSVVVSNDSGAMHVASAVGRPVVALFGPTDERATAPIGPHAIVSERVWCRPCLLRACPIDHRCMRRLPATRVADAVSTWIDLHAA